MHLLLAAVVITAAAAAAVAVVLLGLRLAAARSTLQTATVIVTQSPGNQSPRAVAHAEAVLAASLTDTVIFVSEPPAPPPRPRQTFVPIPAAAAATGRRSVGGLARKLAHFASALYSALRTAACQTVTVRHVILNTPPALPTLPLLALLRPFLFPGARLTVDVHNLAFSLMRLTSPRPVVLLATALEALALRLPSQVCTVSAGLAAYLRSELRVPAAVVRDRPSNTFCAARAHPPSRSQLYALLRRHATVVAPPGHPLAADAPSPASASASASASATQHCIIVAPTSWTPDEDFEPLRAALATLDARGRPVTAVLTGRGPLRAGWERRMRDAGFGYVGVAFAFLSREDYAGVLAGADAGVCMHASSSGLDLPMKAVDMLGAGLPAVARRYACIGELVLPGRSGFLWGDAGELAATLDRLLFSDGGRGELEAVRRWLARDGAEREAEAGSRGLWQMEWERKALPLLRTGPDGGKRS